jgi:hypothetical protein
METQIEIPTTKGTIAQPKEVLPTDSPTPLKTIYAKTQIDAPAT